MPSHFGIISLKSLEGNISLLAWGKMLRIYWGLFLQASPVFIEHFFEIISL